jgi:hypothetical protein
MICYVTACYAELLQSVFEINLIILIKNKIVCCVIQAQLVDLHSELCEVRATKSVLDREVHNLLLQLHACQLQLHQKNGVDVDSASIKAKLVCDALPFLLPTYISLLLWLV